jgi:nucleoside-diphosphate-sugar epimerase
MMESGLRALLTGASGFLGSHLVQSLNASGWVIAAIARPKPAITLSADGRIATVFQYTGETDQVCQAVSDFQPDVVFHLASLFRSEHTINDIEGLVQGNILLGTQLLEAMKLAGARALVNTGTSWQNYAGAEYEPQNLYAATKQAFEDILRFYTITAHLRCITLRLFDTYGPHDTRRKLVSAMLECLRTGTLLKMSPGDQIIDLLHVDDLSRAVLQAASLVMEQKEPAAAVYAVGGGSA